MKSDPLREDLERICAASEEAVDLAERLPETAEPDEWAPQKQTVKSLKLWVRSGKRMANARRHRRTGARVGRAGPNARR